LRAGRQSQATRTTTSLPLPVAASDNRTKGTGNRNNGTDNRNNGTDNRNNGTDNLHKRIQNTLRCLLRCAVCWLWHRMRSAQHGTPRYAQPWVDEPSPSADVATESLVPAQGGRGGPVPVKMCVRCGRGRPSPGADVAGAA
jgi:hypothetical protein